MDVDLAPRRDGFVIEARVRTDARTGAEMEALHAVAVAALTAYDMVKATDKAMTIGEIRLVKKTVNFDDPSTYHLYYGDGLGRPGTIMTFFPWPGVRSGTLGSGQTRTTAFAVPETSLDFWRRRLG